MPKHMEHFSAARAAATLITGLLLALAQDSSAIAAGPGQSPDSYWLLVTFAASGTTDEMDFLKESAFDGIAIQIDGAYDTGPAPSADALSERLAPLKASAARDMWPWVFVNRVPQLDLTPGGAAQRQFLDDWRSALRAAQRVGAPGVVLDLEFYSNPGIAYAISRFAQHFGVSALEAAHRLEGLGSELADIAAAEYSSAKIWVLTSGLDNPADERIGGATFYQPRGHITLGLLQRLGQLKSANLVIDGGEDNLGYCHTSVADLQAAIRKRQQKEQPLLGRFPSSLVLSGTVAPWSAAANKKGWLKEGDCGRAQADRAEDFAPYLQLLDGSYKFNWIYAAPIGGYQPFDRQVAPRFDRVLRGARAGGSVR